MDEDTITMARAAITEAAPMREAIAAAALSHPSIAGLEGAALAGHLIEVEANALAMASLCGPDGAPDAKEIVDDAVVALSACDDRDAAPMLDGEVAERHVRTACRMRSSTCARQSGYVGAECAARLENALTRVSLIRAARGMAEQGPASVRTILETCTSRKTPIGAMSDAEMMEVVEDAFADAALRMR